MKLVERQSPAMIDEINEREAPAAESGVELLKAIVRDKRQPLHLRVNCAKALLPFEVPKLAVTGYVRITQASLLR